MAEDLVLIRMRLSGGKQVAAEGQTAAKGVAAPGAAAEASAARTAKASSSIRDSLQKQVSTMRTVGRGLSRFVTLPLLGVGVAAGAFAISFDKAMRNVNSIAQLPEPAFQKLSKDVLALAGPTAQSPKTLAEGLYDLVSSGFDARESLIVLRKSALAATAGLTTTEISTKAVAAVLNAYQLPARRAGQVSDQLFETVNRGVLTFEDLASQIGDVLPFAAQMGVGLDQIGASISTMTKAGLSAPETMTRIKNTLVTLLKPGEELGNVLKRMGVSGEELVRKRGLQGALEALIAQTDGSKEAIAALFPNIRALGGVLALTGGNVRRANEDLAAFKDTSGATAKALSQQSQSAAFKMQKAWAELQVGLIEFGQQILPIVIPPFLALVHIAQRGLEWFSKLPKPVRDTAGALLVLAATAGPLLLLSASVIRAAETLGLLSGPLTAKGFAGGFAKALPIAFAAAGIANIAISATKGEWRQAGFEAGGALVGGILGAPFGPAGIMVGAGLGSFVGGALGDQFSGMRKLGPLQAKLLSSGRELAELWQRQRRASDNLSVATERIRNAQRRRTTTSRRLKIAEQDLSAVAQEYGLRSRPALRAELRLTRAIGAHRRALQRLKRAQQLQGTALAAYKTITNRTVLEERHRINVLEALARKQEQRYRAARKQAPGSERELTAAQNLQGTLGKLSKATGRHAETLQDAATKGGARYAKWLRTADQESLRFGGRLKMLSVRVRGLTENLQRLGEAPPLPRPPEPFNPSPVFPGTGGRERGRRSGPRRRLGALEPKVRGANLKPLIAEQGKGGPIIVKTYLNRRQIAEAVAEEQDDERARL